MARPESWRYPVLILFLKALPIWVGLFLVQHIFCAVGVGCYLHLFNHNIKSVSLVLAVNIGLQHVTVYCGIHGKDVGTHTCLSLVREDGERRR